MSLIQFSFMFGSERRAMTEDNISYSGGEVLGDYKIIRKLEETSWSVNLLAEHRFIKKRFILQILAEELSSSQDFIQTFEELVVKLAVLDHPGIAKVQNVSCYNGNFFLVTEDFGQGEASNGVTLTQYVSGRHEGLSESETVSIAVKIAEALDYAHDKGVVHFCLHPDNVFVRFRSGEPEIIIPDFCLGALTLGRSLRCIVADGDLGKSFSGRHTVVALAKKLSFLAPEIRRGEDGDARSDSYSFGAVVYYLLFKEAPEGVLSLDALGNGEERFDWRYILESCLKEKPGDRSCRLRDLFFEKPKRDEVHSLPEGLSDTVMSDSVALREPEGLYGGEFRPEKLTTFKEEKSSFSFFNESQPEFVLVAAKSIDEAMETTVERSHVPSVVEEKPEIKDDYSGALQAMFNRDPVVSRYCCHTVSGAKIDPLLTETVYIRGGEFFRGSQNGKRDEQPVGKVILNAFLMEIHPVTNEQYLRFLEFSGGEKDQNYNDLIRLKESRIQRRSGKLFIDTGYDKHPVVGVTWYGAYGYASWIGRRLPTEAEWEIAAKGGKDYAFPTGDTIEKHEANFFSSDTVPVMSYRSNPYGLYDMAGNVYEWCHDWYGYDYYEISASEPYYPQGPLQGVYRVLRGGCWKSLTEDLRCAHRHRNNPGTVNSTYGFRCVLDIG